MEQKLDYLSPAQENYRQREINMIKKQFFLKVTHKQIRQFRKFYCLASFYQVILYLIFASVLWTEFSEVYQALLEISKDFKDVKLFIDMGINNFLVHFVFYQTIICNVNQENYKKFVRISYLFFMLKIGIAVYGIRLIFREKCF